MLIVEYILLGLMFSTCLYVTITDLKNSIIENKILLASFLVGLILNAIYYGVICREYFIIFLLNFAVMTAISIVFYAMHFWAAGDSKMLIAVVFLLPAGLYYNGKNISAAVALIIIIFSIAFIYTVIESIVIGISQKDLFNFKSINIDVKSMIIQYVKCSCIITLVNIGFFLLSPSFQSENKALLMILNMVIVFLTYGIKFFNKPVPLAILIIITGVMFVTINGLRLNMDTNYYMYLFTILVLFLRLISEKYNYIDIPTCEVKKGMVLSYATVLLFLPSNVKQLPKKTTEDVRSKINEDQAESIRRWENSKYGKPTITIVRKMPFAIFITLGTVLFLSLRLFVL